MSHIWDTTGEDDGPPVVNDDDGVILSVQYSNKILKPLIAKLDHFKTD